MTQSSATKNSSNILITLAAFVIVVAGMREAQELLVPFLLSGFIAIIAAPFLFLLQRLHIPTFIALLVVVGTIVGGGVLLGGLVGGSLENFTSQIPVYQAKLQVLLGNSIQWLGTQGLSIPEDTINTLFEPGKAMKMAAQALSSLGGLLTNTFLILLTVIFILLEASSFPHKLQRIFPASNGSLGQFDTFLDKIKQYMVIKTITSLLTGATITLLLTIIGVDYPLLWGVMAFFLNFVPNIGSIIAAVPAVLLALVQLGTEAAIWTVVAFLVVNNLIGTIIEPRFMGKGLGLSTLVVFVSLVFWGWVLGMVGMFLSVPLTMTLKIALDSRDETRWIAILLGPEEDDAPPSRPTKLSDVVNWLPKPSGKKSSDSDR
ncbi:MAG: AI-2E family transporter [Gammaproteobacteria bacterium]|nr:AI-2E family transporter [Gammaproteobacteria bacterium]